jgi:hypothetical protein
MLEPWICLGGLRKPTKTSVRKVAVFPERPSILSTLVLYLILRFLEYGGEGGRHWFMPQRKLVQFLLLSKFPLSALCSIIRALWLIADSVKAVAIHKWLACGLSYGTHYSEARIVTCFDPRVRQADIHCQLEHTIILFLRKMTPKLSPCWNP